MLDLGFAAIASNKLVDDKLRLRNQYTYATKQLPSPDLYVSNPDIYNIEE